MAQIAQQVAFETVSDMIPSNVPSTLDDARKARNGFAANLHAAADQTLTRVAEMAANGEKLRGLRTIKSEGSSTTEQFQINPLLLDAHPDLSVIRDTTTPEFKASVVKLAHDLVQYGMQTAIKVMPNPAVQGRYFVVKGLRRLYAALYALNQMGENFDRVPVVSVSGESRPDRVTMMYANLSATDSVVTLTDIERGNAYHQLIQWGQSAEGIAQRVGVAAQTIKNLLAYRSVVSDEPKIAAMVNKGAVTRSIALTALTEANGDAAGALKLLDRAMVVAKASKSDVIRPRHFAAVIDADGSPRPARKARTLRVVDAAPAPVLTPSPVPAEVQAEVSVVVSDEVTALRAQVALLEGRIAMLRDKSAASKGLSKTFEILDIAFDAKESKHHNNGSFSLFLTAGQASALRQAGDI